MELPPDRNLHQCIQLGRPSVHTDRGALGWRAKYERLLFLAARGLLDGDSLATVLHLEVVVGAGDEQGALDPVAVTFFQNHVDLILCPD